MRIFLVTLLSFAYLWFYEIIIVWSSLLFNFLDKCIQYMVLFGYFNICLLSSESYTSVYCYRNTLWLHRCCLVRKCMVDTLMEWKNSIINVYFILNIFVTGLLFGDTIILSMCTGYFSTCLWIYILCKAGLQVNMFKTYRW